MLHLVSDQINVTMAKAASPLKHHTRAGECWIVEWRTGFYDPFTEPPCVTCHVAFNIQERTLADLMATRWGADFAIVGAEPFDRFPRLMLYTVALVGNRNRSLPHNLKLFAERAVNCVREFTFFTLRGRENGQWAKLTDTGTDGRSADVAAVNS